MSTSTNSYSHTHTVHMEPADNVEARAVFYSTTQYRPEWVREELHLSDDGKRFYVVECGGPVLKKDGTPHRTNRGSECWHKWDDVPEDLRRFLLGPAAMWDAA